MSLSEAIKEEIRSLNEELVRVCVERYCNKIRRLDHQEDFVYSLHPTKPHIMYRLKNGDGALYLKGRDGRKYEFLVEFDCADYAYGIYFGCRCEFGDSLEGDGSVVTHHVKACNEEWNHIKSHVINNLNNTFVDLDFSKREIPTNNANEGTYWPFWFRLGEEEDVEEVAALATKIIRNTYQWFFKEENYERILQSPIKRHVKRGPKKSKTKTRYTNNEYQKIIEKLQDRELYCEGAVTYFERFLELLVSHEIIRPHEIYEKCWVVNRMSNGHFADLIAAFSNKITIQLSKRKLTPKGGANTTLHNTPENSDNKDVSWSLFSPIILSSSQGTFDEIRKEHGHTNEAQDGKIERIISELFPKKIK